MHPHPKGYVCPFASRKPDLSGRIDDPLWQTAPWTDPFLDISGPDFPTPRLETRAKLMWDAQNLYIAAHLVEPDIWATYTDHDSIVFHENDFEVFIDPDGDNHNYYEWEVNALGTTFDLFMARPYRADCRNDDSWDPQVELRIGLDGPLNNPAVPSHAWTVEAAFPWSCFDRDRDMRGGPPALGDQWRVNFSRVEWDLQTSGGKYEKVPDRPEHNWVWSPQWLIDMHVPWLWGYVQFEGSAQTPFQPDPHHAARMSLAETYWFQLQELKEHGRYAASHPHLPQVQVETTAEGYVASLQSHGTTLTIDHLSRLTVR